MKEIQTPYFQFFQFNSPFEDPHLLIKDKRSGSNILFDCGDLSKIPQSELSRVDYLFVTHFHMDHFIGFTQLLRILLSAPPSRKLHIFGPEGLSDFISHTIAGFCWNLLDHSSFSIALTEVRRDELWEFAPRVFHTIPKNPIAPKILPVKSPELLTNPYFSIEYLLLDHKIPVLGFRLVQKPQIHFLSENCPYPPGPWIQQVKLEGLEKNYTINISSDLHITLEELRAYFSISPTSHFTYLTDFLYNAQDADVISFVKKSKILFIESHFLAHEENLAQKTYHLSTKQVGQICALAKPQLIHLFHFSRRYFSSASYQNFWEEVQHWQNENLSKVRK